MQLKYPLVAAVLGLGAVSYVASLGMASGGGGTIAGKYQDRGGNVFEFRADGKFIALGLVQDWSINKDGWLTYGTRGISQETCRYSFTDNSLTLSSCGARGTYRKID